MSIELPMMVHYLVQCYPKTCPTTTALGCEITRMIAERCAPQPQSACLPIEIPGLGPVNVSEAQMKPFSPLTL